MAHQPCSRSPPHPLPPPSPLCSATCAFCLAGSETAPSSYQACTQCQPGFVMAADGSGHAASDSCSACPVNYYQAQSGQSACTVCPKGSETTDTGNSECSQCAKGFYNNVAGEFAHWLCLACSFGWLAGCLDACCPLPCPASPLAPTPCSRPNQPRLPLSPAGQSCVAAPAGTFVNTSGASTYAPCAMGSFSNEQGADACSKCPSGQYANSLGSKACKTCPAGTFSAGGATACKTCSAGYYSPAGSGGCSPCKSGTFSRSVNSATCSACPAGSQCPLIATTAPVACRAGHYASKAGASLCSPCPINTYQSSTGSTSCKACAAGTATRGLTGQSACTKMRTSLRRSL